MSLWPVQMMRLRKMQQQDTVQCPQMHATPCHAYVMVKTRISKAASLPTAARFTWKSVDLTDSEAAMPRRGKDLLETALQLLTHISSNAATNSVEHDCCQQRPGGILGAADPCCCVCCLLAMRPAAANCFRVSFGAAI